MTPIKIVYVLGSAEIGGTERQFLEVLRHIDRRRFELHVLTFRETGPLLEAIAALRVPIKCLGFEGICSKWHPKAYIQLYKLIRQMHRFFSAVKPDIVQTFLFWSNVYGCIAAKMANVPIIITGRRVLSNLDILRSYYQWFLGLSNLWATTIIANSCAAKQYALDHEKWIEEGKLRVLYNGIDLKRYAVNINASAQKKALGISEQSIVIGCIANLHPYKGLSDLLYAYRFVLQRVPQSVLLLVGRDCGIRKELETLAHSLGIAHAVILAGERRDIPEILAVCDLLVSASHTESLSNALLEGMAAGKAIVATQVGGSSELIEHGRSGLLVPPGQPRQLAETMLSLLQNKPRAGQFGKASRERAAQLFDMTYTVKELEHLYLELALNRHQERTPA